MKKIKSMKIEIAGMGLIFYSPFSVAEIKDGDDYFSSNFESPAQVEEQAIRGGVVGVNLGSSGKFNLNIFPGYPSEERVDESHFKLRAGINVGGGAICIRDLFDLMDWYSDLPEEQIIPMEDGFYHMTLLSWRPKSGVLGDNQDIEIYLQILNAMPELKFAGVPSLF